MKQFESASGMCIENVLYFYFILFFGVKRSCTLESACECVSAVRRLAERQTASCSLPWSMLFLSLRSDRVWSFLDCCRSYININIIIIVYPVITHKDIPVTSRAFTRDSRLHSRLQSIRENGNGKVKELYKDEHFELISRSRPTAHIQRSGVFCTPCRFGFS